MIGQDMVNQLYDCQVIDPHGEKIGAVKRIWLDEVTGDPVWASVNMGMFGQKEIFIPLQRAELHQDQLQVPVEKAQVKEAPRIEAEGDLMTPEEQQTLYRFYGMSPVGEQDMGGQDMGGQSTGSGQSMSGQSMSGQGIGGQGMSGQSSGGQGVTIGAMSVRDMDLDSGGTGSMSDRDLGDQDLDDQGTQGGAGTTRSGR